MAQSHTNPFEDEQGSYQVLVNDEGQHSLWPAQLAVPAGWRRAFGPEARASCLRFVDESWRDLRPRSLVEAAGGEER
ncbi:MAG: MbtH family protein [Myxococcales bacterium]|nr:MbtH family protein [Myxococcales bacterium]HRC55863.1 MbtH family protein [Kofleriaceae bacterium]